MVYVDFKKAFDSVSHNKLFIRLDVLWYTSLSDDLAPKLFLWLHSSYENGPVVIKCTGYVEWYCPRERGRTADVCYLH